MKEISVIVPVYNVEKYLEKCVDSILSQTFKDFEVILVDDGSKDRCGIICDKYESLDNRVKVIHKTNGGLSSARNSGLEIASGEYVAFVDSDDWIDKSMYKELYNEAKKHNADIVQCKFIKAKDENVSIYNNESNEAEVIRNLEALCNLYNEKCIETVVTWNKLYRRYLFNDIVFPNGKIHEDQFTTYKLLYKANKVVLVDKELYYYRQTPNSIMNSDFNMSRLDFLEALDQRLEFFKKINNELLYKQTIKTYVNVLKEYYFKCQNSKNEEQILKIIREKYKKKFIEYMNNNEVGFKDKVINTIFLISPGIYKNMKKMIE
ncbi:glycosyltransferase [Clostridium sp.]|uniref:glycosyltransferase family 2 protein n=1 Tax=Clostridium sp. TaxID=1506 RepID=UPI00284917CA|nr:glycosyltransferase [Clostridium sp.]MDR3598468.1 glycosyltransferase [Clostridium sp.]